MTHSQDGWFTSVISEPRNRTASARGRQMCTIVIRSGVEWRSQSVHNQPAMKRMDTLRKVQIKSGDARVIAWEAKDPSLRVLGRWSDPKALLRRIYEFEHPEAAVPEGPGRQWQATWRGRFTPAARSKSRKAA